MACALGGGVRTIRDLEKLRINEIEEYYGYIIFEEAREEYRTLIDKGFEYFKPRERRKRFKSLRKILEAIESPDVLEKEKEFQERLNRLNLMMLG